MMASLGSAPGLRCSGFCTSRKSRRNFRWVSSTGQSTSRILNCEGSNFLSFLTESFPISEEGARFPISMVASGVWAGDIPLERAHSLQEIGPDRRTMKQELERIGYLGEANASYQTMPLGVRCAISLVLAIAHMVRLISNCISVNTPSSSSFRGLQETAFDGKPSGKVISKGSRCCWSRLADCNTSQSRALNYKQTIGK